MRVERVRLAVQHGRPEQALALARGIRLSRVDVVALEAVYGSVQVVHGDEGQS